MDPQAHDEVKPAVSVMDVVAPPKLALATAAVVEAPKQLEPASPAMALPVEKPADTTKPAPKRAARTFTITANVAVIGVAILLFALLSSLAFYAYTKNG